MLDASHLARVSVRVLRSVALVAALGLAGCHDRPVERIEAARASPASAANLAQVSGRVALPASGSRPIIALEPLAAHPAPPPSTAAVMDQVGMAFVPDLLLVRVGQAVEFRNSENVLHNIRVTETATGTALFNVSPPPFVSYTHVFDRAGFYRVSCDVHPQMSAAIFVTAAPHATRAAEDGRFTIADVVPGQYRLAIYRDGERLERLVTISSPRTELVIGGGS